MHFPWGMSPTPAQPRSRPARYVSPLLRSFSVPDLASCLVNMRSFALIVALSTLAVVSSVPLVQRGVKEPELPIVVESSYLPAIPTAPESAPITTDPISTPTVGFPFPTDTPPFSFPSFSIPFPTTGTDLPFPTDPFPTSGFPGFPTGSDLPADTDVAQLPDFTAAPLLARTPQLDAVEELLEPVLGLLGLDPPSNSTSNSTATATASSTAAADASPAAIKQDDSRGLAIGF